MHTALKAFLEAPKISELRGEVYLKRFDVTFIVSAMSDNQLSEYQQRALKSTPKKNAKILESLDFGKYKRLVVCNHVLEPNIGDPEFLRAGGYGTIEDFIIDKLTAGEISEIFAKIVEISGMSSGNFDEGIEEAKNS